MKKKIEQNAAFTLIEVMVAMAIFAIASALMAPAFVMHLKINTASEEKNGAIAAAEQVLDDLRFQDPASLPTSGQSVEQQITAGERIYQAVIYYCQRQAYCSSRSRHLKTQISRNGHVIYATETVYTRLR